VKVIIALGSNVGDRAGYLHEGLQKISSLGTAVASPLILETPDESGLGPAYLNTVVFLDTTEKSPCRLLEKLLRIEQQLGRNRRLGKNQPRTLDLDLIATDQGELHHTWSSPEDLLSLGPTITLDLPHPKAAKRAFVIEPLAALVQSYPDAGRIKILASDSAQ
jgi:2-amino-4-hydroxy-6-hydroxymethyldihydropteridine diphosphokinase